MTIGELKKDELKKSKQGKLEDFKRFEQVYLYGVWWTMSDLEKRIGRKQAWIKEHILFLPKFRKILDIDNGGFVYYPKNKNQQWAFHACKMADFLDTHFAEIHKRF